MNPNVGFVSYALRSKIYTAYKINNLWHVGIICDKKTIPIFTFNFAAFVGYLFDFIKNNESKDHK
jgi:hypothetical protein